MNRRIMIYAALGLFGFLVLPWYAIETGLFDSEWLYFYPADRDCGPAPWQVASFGRSWLLPLGVLLAAALALAWQVRDQARLGSAAFVLGSVGLVYGVMQGMLIGPLGINIGAVAELLGDGPRQYGMGLGAVVVHIALLGLVGEGLAARGWLKGDGVVSSALLFVIAGITTFILYPGLILLLRGMETESGSLSPSLLLGELISTRVWSLAPARLGVVWNSLALAAAAGAGSTFLGLMLALVVARAPMRGRGALRILGILPIITPPFVLGLALILLFGRAGALTTAVAAFLNVEPTRYIFGFWGLLLAQLLAFTPIAFLVLVGVVESVDPSLEEAASTLGASPRETFFSITLPLLRPGIANAFLLGFIESLADFGNPLVLGGNFEVLSTEIYFAVAGAEGNMARAAALAIVLLVLTLGTFVLQRRWVGESKYVTVSGKQSSGAKGSLPPSVRRVCKFVALGWVGLTLVVYVMAIGGGFVRIWGRDHSFTLEHFSAMFSVRVADGFQMTGAAWDSLFTTLAIASIAAPITAALGVLIGYLLARQKFRGRNAFEFATMLSFAVPGTVIGVSYVSAFNVPPIEITGTALILVLCFTFRNLPVGVRASVAALSQIDPQLDEASTTLGASSFETFRRVTIPLLRPATTAALIYGFVRAMTAVSAVIFLVSAEHELSTIHILGQVEAGEYGPAIAYSSALIVLMVLISVGLRKLVGEGNLGREAIG